MSNDRYPPPSYAATIWLSGDVIMLALPEAGCVQIPLSRFEPQVNGFGNIVPGNRGVGVLIDILRQRMAGRHEAIGRPGAPVRNDVEKALESDEKYAAWLSAMAEDKAAKAAARAEAEAILSEIGL